jgi:hypothetical protein
MQNDDSNFWPDGDEDPTYCAANVDPVMEQVLDVSIEVEAYIALYFKEDYVKSKEQVMEKEHSLFTRFAWRRRPVATHPPKSDIDVGKLLDVLRRISPLIGDELKIDSTNIKKHPEI